MTDLLTPDDLLLRLPRADRDLGTRDIAYRSRQWFEEAMAHRVWRNYIREAEEDEGYYSGVDRDGKPYGAWSINGSTQEAREIADSGRPVVSMRRIKPKVDMLVGTERQNRMDLRALPQGDEDEDDARIMTELLKWVADQKEANEIHAAGFKEGLVRGMYAIEVGIDWASDIIQGDPYLELLKPGVNVIWDPWWKKHDFALQTARYVIRYEWAWVEDVIAQNPEKEDEIRQSLGRLMQPVVPEARSTDGGADPYGSVTSHPMEPQGAMAQFYDPAMQRILVLTAWWREWRLKWIVADKATGQIHDFEDETSARDFAKSDPANLKAVGRRVRVIRTATTLPATMTTVEDETDSPYANDTEQYPVTAFLADWTGDVIEGLVRALKDPERISNKRISQALELAQKYGSMRAMFESRALVNPNALDDPADQTPIEIRPGQSGKIGWFQPTGLMQAVQVHESIANDMKTVMLEIGPNQELLGQQGQAVSGIAMARRQMAGQTISLPYFDNHRRTRKLVGERLARRVQQSFTLERTMRLVGGDGRPMSIRLNPVEFRRQGYDKDALKRLRQEMMADPAKPRILRDVESLKFDLVISEAPATPTALAALIEQLLNVLQQYPAIFPLVADIVFTLLPDLPDRPQVLQRVRQWMASQGIQGDGIAPPQPPPGPGGPFVPGAQPGEVGRTVAPAPPGAMMPAAVPTGAMPTGAAA